MFARSILVCLAFVSLLINAQAFSQPTSPKPNVLLIVSDDQGGRIWVARGSKISKRRILIGWQPAEFEPRIFTSRGRHVLHREEAFSPAVIRYGTACTT